MIKTLSAKKQEVEHGWLLVNAQGHTLGRLATLIASVLRGKHKPEFTPHVDTGDFVIVTNVDKIVVTGNKARGKKYYRHTGYPGGVRETTFEEMMAKDPTKPLMLAVKGMLPKNALGYAMIKKLKVYAGDQHPHAAQQPKQLGV